MEGATRILFQQSFNIRPYDPIGGVMLQARL
jgi:hypothetical protein